jgi:hypothetical protein
VHADLVEVAHGKFGGSESSGCGALCVDISKLFVLGELALMTAEEPLADGHVCLRLALT